MDLLPRRLGLEPTPSFKRGGSTALVDREGDLGVSYILDSDFFALSTINIAV
jgi:hypothetical protein